jgi:tight adherence protein C
MTEIATLLPSDNLLAWLVGALTFASVIGVWHALVEERPRVARARAIARWRATLEAGSRVGRRSRKLTRRIGPIQSTARRLRLLQTTQAERIRDRLLHAGLRSREAVAAYIIAKLISPLAFAIVGFILIEFLQFGPLASALRPAILALAALAGFFCPDLYLLNRAARRTQMLQKALPDGLDLLVICAEAGLSLDAALSRVAEEMAVSSPELADELAVTSVELNFLPERRLALLNLARRVDLPAARGVVSTLVQTEKYGTPLAQSLRVLSAELREQRMLRAEEKAARLPAILTVPMVLFILPTLFIVLIGPALIDVYDRFTQ